MSDAFIESWLDKFKSDSKRAFGELQQSAAAEREQISANKLQNNLRCIIDAAGSKSFKKELRAAGQQQVAATLLAPCVTPSAAPASTPRHQAEASSGAGTAHTVCGNIGPPKPHETRVHTPAEGNSAPEAAVPGSRIQHQLLADKWLKALSPLALEEKTIEDDDASDNTPISDFIVIQQATRRLWGQDATPRDYQLQLLRDLGKGRNVFCSIPMGRGKTGSCALVASLIPGCHILVQPTRALIQATAQELHSLGVQVAVVPTNGVSSAVLKAMVKGNVPNRRQCVQDMQVSLPGFSAIAATSKKGPPDGFSCVIVTSAEQLLNSKKFRAASLAMRQPAGVPTGCIFLDEAHLNNEWSSFRPDLSLVGKTAKSHGYRTVVMSATLTSQHVINMASTLELATYTVVREPMRIHAAMQIVPASSWGIPAVSRGRRDDLLQSADAGTAETASEVDSESFTVFGRVLEACARLNEGRCALVFLNNKAMCKKLSKALCARLGENSAVHHHSADDQGSELTMQANLARWLAGEVPIMVATIGMSVGIHNPHCDVVIMTQPPDNVSQLTQMAGRCGRQAQPGLVTIIHSREEVRDKWWLLSHPSSDLAEDPAVTATKLAAFHEVELLLKHRRVHAVCSDGADEGSWLPKLLTQYFSHQGISVGLGTNCGSSQLIDAKAIILCLRDYLLKSRSTLPRKKLENALMQGVLEMSALSSAAKAATDELQTLRRSFTWLAKTNLDELGFERILRAGHDAGLLEMLFTEDGWQGLRAARVARTDVPQVLPLWVHSRVQLTPFFENSTAMQDTPSTSQLEKDGRSWATVPLEQQHNASVDNSWLTSLSDAARTLCTAAEETASVFMYKTSHAKKHTAVVTLYYQCCLCEKARSGRGSKRQQHDDEMRATVTLDVAKRSAFIHMRGRHYHVDPQVPADDFDDPDSAGVRCFYRLPLHPVMVEKVQDAAAAQRRPTPMELETQLASDMPSGFESTTVPFNHVPKPIFDAGEAALEGLAASGLGQRHGLHRQRVNIEYIKNQFQQLNRPLDGESHWDSFVRAIEGNSSFLHRCCFGDAGSTNDSWLFVQTPQMLSLSKSLSTSHGFFVTYEDDTGGVVKYRSKLFVWMIRCPDTGLGLPLAYMLYTPGAAQLADRRKDGLVQSLVWAYNLLESRSGHKFLAKMMDKCSHGQAAWAIFQADKLRKSIEDFLDNHEVQHLSVYQHLRNELGLATSSLDKVPSLTASDMPSAEAVTSASWGPFAEAADIVHSCLTASEVKHKLEATQGLEESAKVLIQRSGAKLFLCHFHALKATNDTLSNSVRDKQELTAVSFNLKALFRARDLGEASQVLRKIEELWGKKYPKVHQYLSKHWCTDLWKPMWGLWNRAGLDMDNTTNLVEAHWQVLKYKILQRRVNHDPSHLFRRLIGFGVTGDAGGDATHGARGLVGFIFRRHQASRAGIGQAKQSRLRRGGQVERGKQIYAAHLAQRTARVASATRPVIEIVDSTDLLFSVESLSTTGVQYNCSLGRTATADGVRSSSGQRGFCDCPDGPGGRCKHIVACALLATQELGVSGFNHLWDTFAAASLDSVAATSGSERTSGQLSGNSSTASDPKGVKSSAAKVTMPAEILQSIQKVDSFIDKLCGDKRPATSILAQVLDLIQSTSAAQQMERGDSSQSASTPQIDPVALKAKTTVAYAKATQSTGHHARKDRGTKRARHHSDGPLPAARIEHRRTKNALKRSSTEHQQTSGGHGTAAGLPEFEAALADSAYYASPVPVVDFSAADEPSSKVRLHKVLGGYSTVPAPVPSGSGIDEAQPAAAGARELTAEEMEQMRQPLQKTRTAPAQQSHPLHNKTQARNNIRTPGNLGTFSDLEQVGIGTIVHVGVNAMIPVNGMPTASVYGIVTEHKRQGTAHLMESAVYVTAEGHHAPLSRQETNRFVGLPIKVGKRAKPGLVVEGNHTVDIVCRLSSMIKAQASNLAKLPLQMREQYVIKVCKALAAHKERNEHEEDLA